mmetsp:Transcript_33042/g.72461  ORF Transcript_33042/g.72461 Transcript_33042/m.72461 type:complete len:296 (-) Transcript_33042:104-991(-)
MASALDRMMRKGGQKSKGQKRKVRRVDQASPRLEAALPPLPEETQPSPIISPLFGPLPVNEVAGHSNTTHKRKLSFTSKLDEMLADMQHDKSIVGLQDDHHLKSPCLQHGSPTAGVLPGLSVIDDMLLDFDNHDDFASDFFDHHIPANLPRDGCSISGADQGHHHPGQPNPLRHSESMPAPSSPSKPVHQSIDCVSSSNIKQHTPEAPMPKTRTFADCRSAEDAASNPLFDPLHMHTDSGSRPVEAKAHVQKKQVHPSPLSPRLVGTGPGHHGHVSDRGLDEFLKWAFENPGGLD